MIWVLRCICAVIVFLSILLVIIAVIERNWLEAIGQVAHICLVCAACVAYERLYKAIGEN